jgi:hypothetical protein
MLNIAQSKPYGDQVQWIMGSYEKLEGMKTDLILMTSHVAQFFIEDTAWTGLLKSSYEGLNQGGYIIFDSRNPLTKPWLKWTRETSSRKLHTSSSGQVEMWYQLIEMKDNHVLYEIHYFFEDSNEELVSLNRLIYRSQNKISDSLIDAGFSIQNIYGDWDGNSLESSSPEIIFIAYRR